MRILVTGASGFLGRALCPALAAAGHSVRGAVRSEAALPSGGRTDDPVGGDRQPADARGRPDPRGRTDIVAVGEIGPGTDWSAALAGIDAVIHLAARVHVRPDAVTDSFAAFRAVNVFGTERLARAAADAGVRRLVFVSSIKVHGERTLDRPITESDPPAPQDAYGHSKAEAEAVLRRVGAGTGLEVVIVRPPLVYGPEVKGNFLRLLRLVSSRVPLPLGGIENRRSLVYRGNLVALLERCAVHPAAAGEVFLAADGEDLSTAALIRRLAAALGTNARLLPAAPGLLRAIGRIGDAIDRLAPLGGVAVPVRSTDVERLIGSLVVDARKAARLLGYTPPFALAEGLDATAGWYRARRGATGEVKK